ncbi:MAG: hypothetical protein A2Y40_04815 [Candidatus Margulisbacteria bacterium GWF2_35_9]|nr:MAG: hypothetical protein A2Y40_04815 [Candidatus Margulisbacteria bacterium GWF2_35_9]
MSSSINSTTSSSSVSPTVETDNTEDLSLDDAVDTSSIAEDMVTDDTDGIFKGLKVAMDSISNIDYRYESPDQ